MNPLDLKLYELFSDKTLSEGCLISGNKYIDGSLSEDIEYAICYKKSDQGFSQCEHCIATNGNEYAIYWVFGHEPTITDVFRVVKEKGYAMQQFLGYGEGINNHLLIIGKNFNNLSIAYNPILPLIQQADETKSQLIDLFQRQ